MSLFSRMSVRICLASAMVAACLAPLPAQKRAVDMTPKPVATFNGRAITEDELRKAAASELDEFYLHIEQLNAEMTQVEHQILETNLIRLLVDKTLEAEAAKRGISKERLIETETAGKVKEPSQQEIKAFYDANKQQYNQPLEKVSDEIRQFLKAEHRNKAIGDLADSLKSDYGVTMLLKPLRVKVRTDGSPSLGPENAPVTMVVFSDYQSPYSLEMDKTLREAVKKYGDQVRLVYRYFALPKLHPLAEKASEASFCAADQNHFWEMHDLLFQTQNQLKEADLEANAVKLHLDAEAFDNCLTSGKYAAKVKQDQREGYMAGVAATPALFINGRFLSGVLPLSQISRTIDEELRIKSLRTASASQAEPPSAAKAP